MDRSSSCCPPTPKLLLGFLRPKAPSLYEYPFLEAFWFGNPTFTLA